MESSVELMWGRHNHRIDSVKNNKPPFRTSALEQKGRPFQRALIDWFRREGLDLPWRRTRDPYAVLVSEIMLQQTRIATVLERGFYARWLERFPDVAALAAADESDVLRCWEGLGYYNRARNLRKAARVVVERHGGRFPDDPAEIRALPGIGRYTAGAVASFAFDRPEPIVDGNVARVFARLFDLRETVDLPAGQRKLWELAGSLVPARNAHDFNSGLMELGQRICARTAPACPVCPVARFCKTRRPESLPVRKPKTGTVCLTEHALFAARDGALLLERETGSRRKGLWKLPLIPESEAAGLPVLLKSKYTITHHRVTLIVQGYAGDLTGLDGPENRRWTDIETELPGVAMPSPFRRAVETVLRNRADAANFALPS